MVKTANHNSSFSTAAYLVVFTYQQNAAPPGLTQLSRCVRPAHRGHRRYSRSSSTFSGTSTSTTINSVGTASTTSTSSSTGSKSSLTPNDATGYD